MSETATSRALHILTSFFVTVIICGDKYFASGCIQRERQALIQLKQGIKVDYNGLLSSWENTEDCCRWKGVQCSNRTGSVIMLQLRGRGWSFDMKMNYGFGGEISSSLLELSHLQVLDLSSNNFTQIPELSTESFKNLRYLNLSNLQRLQTPIITSPLRNFSNLQILDLHDSSTVIENLNWLSHLSSLKYLDLSGSDLGYSTNWFNVITNLPSLLELKLSGSGLPGITDDAPFLHPTNASKSLAVLDISFNFLTAPSIYPWLFTFSSSLIDINLNNNMLNGTIPETFGTLSSLEHLDISENELEGGIPISFRNLTNLQSLKLSRNYFLKEELSTLFSKLPGGNGSSLEILHLDNNQLSGSLPDFTTFSSLKELYLTRNELNGPFPQSFGHTSDILILDLSSNQITGSLPDLSVFPSLRELYLQLNRISGELPPSIGQLSNLKILDTSRNLLRGIVSEAHLSNLSHLQILDLSFNSLTLEFDSDWSPDFQLGELGLSSCNVGPSFPQWIRNQKQLYDLDISGGGISGEVPNWFWDLTPSLNNLNLSSNQINGTVPRLLSMSGDLPFIDLSSNNFAGAVPIVPSNTQILFLSRNMFSGSISFLCNLGETSLQHLDLSHNLLEGELPDCWMNMTSLEMLNLGNNKFTGNIPASIGSLSSIRMLSMAANSLTGELPSSLKNCTRLALLDLGDNKLMGNIPGWIGKKLSELIVLSLRFNEFQGTMPLSFCNLAKLQILDISRNNISGTIPKCLDNFAGMNVSSTVFWRDDLFTLIAPKYSILGGYPKLNVLEDYHYMSFDFKAVLQWKGSESEYRSTLGMVKSLDLSSNKFSGEIPGELTTLVGLVALNLSRNNLTGQVPPTIGRMRFLDFLDISRNQLVGRIPTSLAQISSLGVLDISYNKFSGRIPRGTQLQSFDASSYVGNPALCGIPLPNPCPGDREAPQSPRTPDSRNEAENQDKLVTQGFYISLVLGFALGFWGICGPLLVLHILEILDDFADKHGKMHLERHDLVNFRLGF